MKPGDASERYTYGMAEEALLCLWGAGEVFLRGEWVAIAPGDLAFFPADVAHGVRNPQQNREDFVLVSQICLPQFYLYEDGGYYDGASGTMNFPAIESAKRESWWGSLAPATEVKLRETTPSVRA